MYYNGDGRPKDYAQAMVWFQKAADQGNSSAQSNLALMYMKGIGVHQDYAQALSLFRLAAEQNDPLAEYDLSLMYANAWGIGKDNVVAYALCAHSQNEVNIISMVNGSLADYRSKLMNKLGRQLTSAQINEANQLAQNMQVQGVLEALRER
jgi:hypothetical protein